MSESISGVLCIEIGYVQQEEDAMRRLKRGERQLHCGTCGLWRWPDQCQHPDRLTAREFRALVRAAERKYPVNRGDVAYRQALRQARKEGRVG